MYKMKKLRFIPNKVLFLGNSLLLGFDTFGMAAEDSNHDYYYYIMKKLTELNSNIYSVKNEIYSFERCISNAEVNFYIYDILSSLLTNDLDLVIIQAGDNVATDEQLKCFRDSCEYLIKYIKEHTDNAYVVWVGEWFSSKERQLIIADACEKADALFIDISDLISVSGNKNKVGGGIRMITECNIS